MPNEHVSEEIVAAVELDLKAIVAGSTYWKTPSTVVRTHVFGPFLTVPDEDLVYAIVPDDEEAEEDTSRGGLKKLLRFDIWGLQPYDLAEDPFLAAQEKATTDQIRATLQARMQRDVEISLRTSYIAPGGRLHAIRGMENFEIIRGELSPEATWVGKWAIVGLRVLVTYSILFDNP